MDTSILEDLGLTNAEIKVYMTLLKLGSAQAGEVIEFSGIQSSVVYRSFATLIDKSLINFIKKGKKKVYQATKPESFFNFIEEKKRKFTEILPELKKQQEYSRKKETATIFKGISGIKEVYGIMINSKAKEYLTFGGGPVTVDVMGLTWWINLHNRRIANKLPSRQIFDLAVRNVGGTEIEIKKMTDIRYLPAEFAQFQETIIVGDKVAITVFSEQPYAFLIEDKNVAEGYKKYFELLWKRAKK